MAACKSVAVGFMVTINVIFAILGIAIIGVAGYGLTTFDSWKEYTSQEALISGVVFGVVVFLLSLLGCVGSIKQNKTCLGIYLFAQFVVTAVLIAISAGALVYGGQLSRADTIFGRSVSNIVVQGYFDCCTRGGFDVAVLNYGGSPAVVKTTNDTDGGRPPLCDSSTPESERQLLQCIYPKCNDESNRILNFCSLYQPVRIDVTLCSSISLAVFKSSQVDEINRCSTIDNWGGSVMAFIRDNFNTAGIGLAVIAGICLLLFVASCGLCCTHTDHLAPDEKYEA